MQNTALDRENPSAPADPPIPPQIARRAVRWLMSLQAGPVSDATLRSWQRWHDEHPDHARAWQRIETVNDRLKGIAASPAAAGVARLVLAPRVRGTQGAATRRQAMKALGVLVIGGGAAGLAAQTVPWRRWTADLRTGIGERRDLALADGTRIVLNGGSAVDVSFDAAIRRIRLFEGELLVTSAQDPRPLLVETAQGGLRPIGTRFLVRVDGATTMLAVYDGAVEARPHSAAARIVPAGEKARFSATAIGPVERAEERETAWIDGMIVASGMRLADFVAELARYRAGHIGCDPRIADLRVSGTYPLADTDRIIASLTATLGIEAASLTRYWVTLRPRA